MPEIRTENLVMAAVIEGAAGVAATAITVGAEVGTRLVAAVSPDVIKAAQEHFLPTFLTYPGLALDALYLQHEPVSAAILFGLTAVAVGVGLHDRIGRSGQAEES